MRGYTFQYQGRNLGITVLDCVADYEKLSPQLVYDEDYIYYITKERIFVYQGSVIASGTFHMIQHEPEGLRVREWVKRKQIEMRYGTIDMNNRRKYQYEEKVEERPIEEVKEENPEWFTETMMELSVPSADELDSYFSSIGLEIPGGNF
jgi:hypothetical protein